MIGSLYSGIGGLDLAAESVLGLRTAWQLDQVGHEVRSRHWPDARQVVADVATVDPRELPPVSVLVGGFSCVDLSTAGKGAGLVAGRSTAPTYRGLVRFTEMLSPDLVIMENVPALLSKWGAVLEEDWHRMGYGLTWVKCGAWDAGAPHIRRRVFVVAAKGGRGGRVIDAPQDGRWTGDRTWPTPTAGDAKASGSRCLDSNAHEGTSLTDAVRPDRAVAGERLWATPTSANPNEGEDIASWQERAAAAVPPAGCPGRRLNPDWVETLQGFPIGWTSTTGPGLSVRETPRWPRGRYPADWDRTQHWPGYDWEPSRTLPDGPPVKGRAGRLRALGNAVCPQQGALALRAAQ